MNKKIKFQLLLILIITVVYFVSCIIIGFHFEIPLKQKVINLFISDFYRFFVKYGWFELKEEIVLTSLLESFFLLIIPFFCYILAYVKFFFSIDYFLSHLFYPIRYKRYLKKAEELVFDEEDMDIEIDLSGNFYHADLMVYNYPLIVLTLLPFLLIFVMHATAFEWDDLEMDAEEELMKDRQENEYASLETSLFDEYYTKHAMVDPKRYRYYKTERLIKEVQEESLEDVMEDIDSEEESESLDFLVRIADTIVNLLFNRIIYFLPTPVVNFFKFQDTELALKNLIIFFLYFPFLAYVVCKYFLRLFRSFLRNK